ncbi:MAG: diacylglycerol kinase family protein [Anaerolineae bacterium]|nr:diacylglycerol kinase family protein [Anaerolineae bacterium]
MADETHDYQTGEEKQDVLVTPEGEELDLSITGTMKLNLEGENKNPDRIASIKFAIAGLLYVLTHEQSIRLATIVTVIVVIVGLWLNVGVFSWALLTLALGAVWITECLNTAIEAAIDLGASDPHPLAKIGKDVASTAALVSSIVFVVIVILILLPALLNKLSG